MSAGRPTVLRELEAMPQPIALLAADGPLFLLDLHDGTLRHVSLPLGSDSLAINWDVTDDLCLALEGELAGRAEGQRWCLSIDTGMRGTFHAILVYMDEAGEEVTHAMRIGK